MIESHKKNIPFIQSGKDIFDKGAQDRIKEDMELFEKFAQELEPIPLFFEPTRI
ncbi:MAG: hypothetical protein JKP92_08470 [Alphaproteobacteria bacterium]|jgi:hypothetical protein|nr:hypothetical protein [Alphaproteobacteria bacterium]